MTMLYDLVFHDRDRVTDLAFIEVDGVPENLCALTFAPSTKVPTGTTAIAIGYCTPDAWKSQPLAFVRPQPYLLGSSGYSDLLMFRINCACLCILTSFFFLFI